MTLLQIRDLYAGYGDFEALHGVDLQMARGSVTALVGANGAGKTTLLRAITGLVPTKDQNIWFDGAPVGGWPAHRIARAGVAMAPEGRRLFPSLTVAENLDLGLATGRRGPWTLDRVNALFPILAEKAAMPATRLSGGQQQMVAIGRALMGNPKLLLLDEVSLGLAPTVVADIYAALPSIVSEGATVLLVEQDVGLALRNADRVAVMRDGRVVLEDVADPSRRDAVAQAYFPAAEEAA
ncbi:ABC transporter ATP-binding protein [Jannaschia sp. 2305UL9-9]|uniref:ABC transporter ATP-binding protein n=1 Tax=Jannaschia sp. 2305UL9-9 TaxID=3121638 RepID=UPI003526FFBF